ncbi:hypothetical protein AYL99_01574 [Fonsecaea erecta]|uniref:Uncharacterized protein n=1 Tax=Fonsecaea erecta TaxID=1367422 RepID=A0A179A0T8_9EURO|nr:hypothetical protein AYL99_01574 [Fonsecaea erecta]OAP65602.1 hypothetical protein AYL99_01574 [Fonsecaea erecta]
MSPVTLKTLAALRMLIGASCLLVPRPAGMLFGLPLAPGPEGVLLGRMTGVRDLVLGAYLWKRVRGWEDVAGKRGDVGTGSKAPLLSSNSNNNNKDPTGSYTTATSAVTTTGGDDPANKMASLQLAERDSALRSAVWLGLVVDAIDAGSVVVGCLPGVGGGDPLSDLAKVTVGGGAWSLP